MTKRRLPFASASSGYFELGAEQWQKIEKAYGRKLTAPARERIAALVCRYFEARGLEAASFTREEATEALERSYEEAKKLRALLVGDTGGALEYVLFNRFQAPVVSPLLATLEQFIRACDYSPDAMKTLPEEVGFKPGEAWDDFARSVMQCLASYGFQSKAWFKNGDGKASAVVYLIRELDAAFPKKYQRPLVELSAWAARLKKVSRNSGSGNQERQRTSFANDKV